MSTGADKVYEELRSTYAQLFLYKVRYTEYYSFIQELMREYKNDRRRTNAISLFTRLVRFIKKTDNKDLIDEFNKCLVKEALIPKTEDLREKCRQVLTKQENAVPILQKVSSYFPKNPEPQPPVQYEEMNEQLLMTRLHSKPHHQSIIKIIELYLRCIINVAELRSLLSPYLSRSELIYLVQGASDIESARRKGTSFVPLNQLPEASFAQRMGVSYVEMPACYSKKFDSQHLLPASIKPVLNDKWVSVPLGSEHVSFSIMRKNCYEDELFKNQDEKFELDHTIIELRRVFEKLQTLEAEYIKNKQVNFQGDQLVRKILSLIYGTLDVYNNLKDKPQSVLIIKPRVEEKLRTLERIRQKATKQWQDISIKNFHKSLDHRSFYFRKNEKKYNCTSRWDKELEFRQSLYGIVTLQLNDKDSKDRFNDQINSTVDTFQNVTRQKCIPSRQVSLNFAPTPANCFPAPPLNKVLFVMQFSRSDILTDLSLILNHFISKKNLLQYLMLKMFNLNLKKALEQPRNNKFSHLLKLLDGIKEETNDDDDLMEKRERKKMVDENQEFEDLIEEEIMPIHLKPLPSPFQGPEGGHVFYGTKTHYYFLRYVLTIYQRFIKAKEFAEAKQDDVSRGNTYEMFKAILTHRLKDPKLEQNMRKIFGKDAFLFLSIDKLLIGSAKLINACDELSANIIKQDTKDYQHQIRPLQSFRPKSDYHQMLRLYHQNTSQFRFCLHQDIMYVYSWSSVYKDWKGTEIVSVCENRFNELLTSPYPKQDRKQNIKAPASCEHMTFPNQLLLQPMEEEFFSKRQKINQKTALLIELSRRKKIKIV